MEVVCDKLPSGAEIMSKFGGSTKIKIYMHWKHARGNAPHS